MRLEINYGGGENLLKKKKKPHTHKHMEAKKYATK